MVKDDISPERAGFGMRLKAAREAQRFSQQDIAKRFDINKNTVSAWETGRGDPGVYRLRELSKLYKTSSESLLWENAPSNEAMQIAAAFDGLTHRQQQTFHALWLAFLADAKSDDGVEDAMPITKNTGFEYKRQNPSQPYHPAAEEHSEDESEKGK